MRSTDQTAQSLKVSRLTFPLFETERSSRLFRYGDVLPRETGTCVSVRRFASITVQQLQLSGETERLVPFFEKS
jgi:hypothetical protein